MGEPAEKLSTETSEPSEAKSQDMSIRALVPKDAKALKLKLEELLEEKDEGARISFGFVVLNCVVQSNYDRATSELDHVGAGLEDFPEFERDARRYIEHAKSLVSAIKIKRTISMTPQINKARKRELMEKIMEHFVDLKRSIVNIEKVEKRVRYADLSATIIFFKVAFWSIASVVSYYFITRVLPDVGVVPWEYYLELLPTWFNLTNLPF